MYLQFIVIYSYLLYKLTNGTICCRVSKFLSMNGLRKEWNRLSLNCFDCINHTHTSGEEHYYIITLAEIFISKSLYNINCHIKHWRLNHIHRFEINPQFILPRVEKFSFTH